MLKQRKIQSGHLVLIVCLLVYSIFISSSVGTAHADAFQVQHPYRMEETLASSLPCNHIAGWILQYNAVLYPGDCLMANNTKTFLAMQGDSNLVVYSLASDGTVKSLWATNTVGDGAASLVMQDDGNLVMYTSAEKAIWASKTAGNPYAWLDVQDDGNVVISSYNGTYTNDTVLWATGTTS